MKHLKACLILALVCCSSYTVVAAQLADSWANVEPEGEYFTVRMPNSRPAKTQQQNRFGSLNVAARVYTASEAGVYFTVWSLVDADYASKGTLNSDTYLDASADLLWNSLLRPLRDLVPKSTARQFASRMTYERELESKTFPPGREYAINIGRNAGLTHIYAIGPQIYVLTVFNADPGSALTERFFNSFSLKVPGSESILRAEPLVPPSVGIGSGVGGGQAEGVGGAGGAERKGIGTDPAPSPNIGVDTGKNPCAYGRAVCGGPVTQPAAAHNRVLSGRDVTQKARVTSKPEPQYTESARQYLVQGTVVIRGVFASSGEVRNLKVMKKLPHGLTRRALEAATRITFIPAMKDGHPVSMYIQLEYNFNLY
jgi:TonB family protein